MFIAMTDTRNGEPCIKAQFSNGSDQYHEYVVRHHDTSFQLEIVLVGFSNRSLLALDMFLDSFNSKGEFGRGLQGLFYGDGHISTREQAKKLGVHEEHSPSLALAKMGDDIIQIDSDLSSWTRINRPFNVIAYNHGRSLNDLAALGYGFEDLARVFQTLDIQGTPNLPIRTYRLED